MQLLDRREQVNGSDESVVNEIAEQVKNSWEKWKDEVKVNLAIDDALTNGSDYIRFWLVLSTSYDILQWPAFDGYYPRMFLECDKKSLAEVLNRVPNALSQAIKEGTKGFFEDATEVKVEKFENKSELEILGISFFVVDVWLPKKTEKAEDA